MKKIIFLKLRSQFIYFLLLIYDDNVAVILLIGGW